MAAREQTKVSPSSFLNLVYCQEEHWEDECSRDGIFDEEVSQSYFNDNNNPYSTLFLLNQDLFWEDEELSCLISKEEDQYNDEFDTNPYFIGPCSEAVDWILKVVSHYSFNALTVVLAVNYVDRFLFSFQFQKEKPWMTQLAAVYCLSRAAKVKETQVPLLLDLQIDELASFSDSPAPSVTRILYSEKDVLARRYIKNLMGLSGLSVREDAVGNIFARWVGSEPDLSAVSTGSHIDAIPYSGKYDGVVGVLGAIEAINVLKRSGFKPKRSLEVIMFTSEEPTRFGISCLGSRLLAGSEALARTLKQTVDNHNISFLEAARFAGYAKDCEDISSVFLEEGSYSAFVELHIEQGPLLEEEGISVGIVTAIAAPASIKIGFEGNGGHAGAVLMPQRNDAGLAAAELALAVEKHVLESGSVDTVGTVGILELHPGAINSIPSKAHLEIDTRDIDEKRRNLVMEKIYQSALTISQKRNVKLSEFKIVNQDPPALSEESVIEAMESAAQQLNMTHKKMISRAYHDSLFMARKAPMGMIFIPCFKGYSHKPEEYASNEDIANGVKVLALTLAKLSLSG